MRSELKMSLNFDGFLMQILQPYFLYSLSFLTITYVCVKVFLKYNPNLDHKIRSLVLIVPLFIPFFVLVIFPPATMISLTSSFNPAYLTVRFSPETVLMKTIYPVLVHSLTGTLCIIGIVSSVGYFFVTLIFGGQIVKRIFNVVMLSSQEFPFLQKNVQQISKKMGISPPKIGLIEDLRPNAFTMGYGRQTVIVFSLGLLNSLDANELGAVAAHELSHVKSKDQFFKIFSHSLTLLSFFNPFCYFAMSDAKKERELLADETGARFLGHPLLMANVLVKIGEQLQSFPKVSLASKLSTNLFLVSPLAHRPQLFVAHPPLIHRVNNITKLVTKPKQKPIRPMIVAVVAITLVLSALVSSYFVVFLQNYCLNADPECTELLTSAGDLFDMPETSYAISLKSNSTQPVESSLMFLPKNLETVKNYETFVSIDLLGQNTSQNSLVLEQLSQEFLFNP